MPNFLEKQIYKLKKKINEPNLDKLFNTKPNKDILIYNGFEINEHYTDKEDEYNKLLGLINRDIVLSGNYSIYNINYSRNNYKYHLTFESLNSALIFINEETKEKYNGSYFKVYLNKKYLSVLVFDKDQITIKEEFIILKLDRSLNYKLDTINNYSFYKDYLDLSLYEEYSDRLKNTLSFYLKTQEKK